MIVNSITQQQEFQYRCEAETSCPTDYSESTHPSHSSVLVCNKCSPSCMSCYGPLATQCLSCSTGFTLANDSCVGKYFNARSGRVPVEILTPTLLENFDNDYTISAWFFPIASTSGTLLSFGDLELYISPGLTLKISDSLASEVGAALEDTWSHFAFSFEVSSLAQQLLLNGEIIRLTSRLTTFMRPSPIRLGGDTPCDCDLSTLYIFPKTFGPGVFKHGLQFESLSDTSFMFNVLAAYSLTEGTGSIISGGNGLDVSLSNTDYWRDDSTLSPKLCNYDNREYWDGSTCSACSRLTSCIYCYRGDFCTGCAKASESNPAYKKNNVGDCSAVCNSSFEISISNGDCNLKPTAQSNSALFNTFEYGLDINFPLASSLTVWTVEFWMRAFQNPSIKAYIQLGDSYVAGPMSWKDSADLLIKNVGTPDLEYNHYAFVYSGTDAQVIKNGVSLGTDAHDVLTLSSLQLLSGAATYGLKDLRVWYGALTAVKVNRMRSNRLDPSKSRSLLHYWILYDSELSNTLTDKGTEEILDLSPIGGLSKYGYLASTTSAEELMCDPLTYKSGTNCLPCHTDCIIGCTGSLTSDCYGCLEGYSDLTVNCSGAKTWDTKNAISSLSSGSYTPLIVNVPWTLDFFFKIVSPDAQDNAFLSADSVSFSNSDLTVGCSMFSTTHSKEVSQGIWTHAAIVRNPNPKGRYTKCYLDFVSSPKDLTASSNSFSVSFKSSPSQVYIGLVKLTTTAIAASDMELFSKIPAFPILTVEYFSFKPGSTAIFAGIETSSMARSLPINEAVSYCPPFTVQSDIAGLAVCLSCSTNCLVCTSQTECNLCNPSVSVLSSGACVLQSAFQLSSIDEASFLLRSKLIRPSFSFVVWVFKGSSDGSIVTLKKDMDSFTFSITAGSVSLSRSTNGGSTELTTVSVALAEEWSFLYFSYSSTIEGNSVTYGIQDTELTSVVDAEAPFVPDTLQISGPGFSDVAMRNLILFSASKIPRELKAYKRIAPKTLSNGIVLALPLISDSTPSLGRRLATASTSSALTICDEGYRASDISGTCIPCDDSNCVSCDTDSSTCDNCKSGYGTVNGVCEECDASLNCQYCDTDTTTCSDCLSGTSADENGVCSCPEGEWLDKSQDPVVCKTCYETCKSCLDNDKTCKTCKADPIEMVDDTYCKYYGAFPSDESYVWFQGNCTDSSGTYSPSVPCSLSMRQYCCNIGTTEYLNCRSKLEINCRHCTFLNQTVCDNVETSCWSNYTLIDPSPDDCLKKVYSYCCSNPDECTSFNHTFRCDVIGKPVLNAVIYSPNYLSFNLTFDRAIYTASFKDEDCLQYFEVPAYDSFGSSSSCTWLTNNTVLQVRLGSGMSLKFGPIDMKDNLVKSAYKYSTEYGSYRNLTISLNSVKPKPETVISCPLTLSYCSGLFLDASSSTGGLGRGLSFSWSISSNSTYANFSNTVAQYSAYNDTNAVNIDGYLEKDSLIQVQVTAKNFIDESASANATVYVNPYPIPSVSIQGGNVYRMYASRTLTVSIEIDQPPCMDTPLSYQVEWSLKDSNFTGQVNMTALRAAAPNTYTFVYSPGLLKPNHRYVFNVKATPVGIDPALSGEADLDLTLWRSPPYIEIQGGNRKATLSKQNELDGSGSYDQDDPSSPLNVTWSCSHIYGECLYNTTTPKYSIQPNELKANLTYTFTLTASVDGLASTTSAYLEATDENVPVFYLIKQKVAMNPQRSNTLSAVVESDTAYSIQWELVKGEPLTYLTPLTSQSITIQKDSFKPGKIYTFEVSLTTAARTLSSTADRTLKSTVEVKINSPPCCGKLVIKPSEGNELTTEFSFIATDWDDIDEDLPLSYSVVKKTDGKLPQVLSSSLSINKLNGILSREGEGYTTIELRVFDYLGAWSSTTATVQVNNGFTDQDSRANFVDGVVDALIADIDRIGSFEQVAFSLSSLSNAAFASGEGDTALLRIVFNKMLQLISSLYKKHGEIPNSSTLISSIINSVTQNPRAMDESARNSTLRLVDSLLEINPEVIETEEMQVDMQIIANLAGSNALDNETAYFDQSTYQVKMIDYIEDFGSLYLRDNVRNQEGATFDTDEFVMQLSRNSPDGLPKVKYSVPVGNSTAGVKVPKGFYIGNNVTATDSLDSFLVMTNFKGYKVVSNDTAPPDTSVKYVGDVSIVSFKTKLSGTENKQGTVDLLPVPVTLSFNMTSNATISIPITKIGTEAQPNCTWLNETGNYWTTSGCGLVSYDSSGIQCNCTHFTQFSVQQSGEALVGAAQSANTDEAANFAAIEDINFSSNAIGLYCAATVVGLYILLVILFYSWDKRDIALIRRMNKRPYLRLKALLNRHKHLYPLLVDASLSILSPRTTDSNPLVVKKLFEKVDKNYSSRLPTDAQYNTEEESQGQRREVLSIRELIEEHKRKKAEDSEIDDITRVRQSILIENGVHLSIVNHKINLEKSKPENGFQFRVFINAYIPKQKTKWEYFVFNHPLLAVFFLVKPTLRRVSRLTIMVCAILGRLFASGFFYNTGSSDNAEEDEPIGETMSAYTWYDFWISVLSALLVLPVVWILNCLFETPQVSKSMSFEEKAKLLKKNRIKLLIGYIIAWCFMAFTCFEITIFAIQFNLNVSQLWIMTFSFSTVYDWGVQANIIVVLKMALERTKIRLAKKK